MKLIDVNDVKAALLGWDTDPTDEEIEFALDRIPTVDAVKVVHGQWMNKTKVWEKDSFCEFVDERVDCSVCGHIFWHGSAATYNYCPNCGAKMDKKDG